MNTREIMAAAIALVIGGAVTQESASKKCESIAKELNQRDSKNLKQQLAVMQECVELFNAHEAAKNDWKA